MISYSKDGLKSQFKGRLMKLDDDWDYHARRALRSLKEKIICTACGYIHHSPIATDMMRRLHNAMFGSYSQDISIDGIKHWKIRMYEIDEQYVYETGMSRI